MDIQYDLIKSANKNSRYPFVIIRSYPGFFNYHLCTKADVEKHINNLPELYKVSKDNG